MRQKLGGTLHIKREQQSSVQFPPLQNILLKFVACHWQVNRQI